VNQFILEEDVKGGILKTAIQGGAEVVQEADAIGTPGEAEDVHPVAGFSKIPDQVAVINKAAGDGVQAAVNQQTDMH
jgi:hypothetical protein